MAASARPERTCFGFGLSRGARNAADTCRKLSVRFDRWTLNRVGNPMRSAAFRSLPGMGIAAVGTALVSTGAGLCLVGGVSLLVRFSGDFSVGFIRELECAFVA